MRLLRRKKSNTCPQRFRDQLGALHLRQRRAQAARQLTVAHRATFLGGQGPHVVLGLRTQHVALFDAAQAGGQQHGKVRYGLHAESGLRTSTRRDDALRGVYIGTRTSAERLAAPHDAAVGASPPDQPLVGVHPLVGDGADLRRVLENAGDERLADVGELQRVVGVWKALVSPSNRLMWVCIAEPGYSANGLGMNDARTPSPRATLTTYRNVITLSAIDSASA